MMSPLDSLDFTDIHPKKVNTTYIYMYICNTYCTYQTPAHPADLEASCQNYTFPHC